MKRYISKPIMIALLVVLAIAFIIMFLTMDKSGSNNGGVQSVPTESVSGEVAGEQEGTDSGDAIFEYDYSLENIVKSASDIIVVRLNEDKSDIKQFRYVKKTNDFTIEDIRGLEEKEAIIEAAKEETTDMMLVFIDDSENVITVSEFEVYDATTESDIMSILQ